MIYQRDAQGQHEVAVKHTSLAGETNHLERKGRLDGQGNKNVSEGMGVSQTYPQDNSLRTVLLPGSITAGCFTSRLSEIMTGLMYVPSTRSDIMLRGCSCMALISHSKGMPNKH